MRCKVCDYSLWGIAGRTCPECGNAFKPSEARLVPNAVKFLCPHCKQDYYGTTPTGHLDPVEFDCVSCGAHIHMDEMVLEPREGVKDERTRPDHNPWLQRKTLGTRKAYYRTIGRALGYPTRLARGTPEDSPTSTALGFFAVHVLFISLFTVVPVAVFMAIMVGSMGGIGHRGIGRFLIPALMIVGMPTVGFFGVLFASSLMTQLGLMHFAGRATHLRVTIKALAYASAPLLLMAVPCFGFHLAVFAIPWWFINAIVMLGAMHRIAWWRAALAHVIGVGIAIGVPIGGIWAIANSAPSFGGPAVSPASVAGGILRMALTARTSSGNEHLLDSLINLPNRLPGFQYPTNGFHNLTRFTIQPPDIMIGSHPIDRFLTLAAPVRDPMLADLRAAMLPSGIHRVGHLVLCDAGVDLTSPQGPDLWIAIVWPDPDSTATFTHTQTVTVILASGSAQDITLSQFPGDLATQNTDRRSYGIPEIPDPATVHMWPPGSKFGPSPPPAPVP